MDFSTLIRNRYSVRAYRKDPVEKEKLDQVLEAARLAPTASNRQPFRIIVAQTKGREDEMRRMYDRDWFVEAPIVICVCAVKSEAWVSRGGMNYVYVDVAIVMDHIILAATDLGLGTCWVGAFQENEVAKAVKAPNNVRPVAIVPVGYPAKKQMASHKRSVKDVVHYDTF